MSSYGRNAPREDPRDYRRDDPRHLPRDTRSFPRDERTYRAYDERPRAYDERPRAYDEHAPRGFYNPNQRNIPSTFGVQQDNSRPFPGRVFDSGKPPRVYQQAETRSSSSSQSREKMPQFSGTSINYTKFNSLNAEIQKNYKVVKQIKAPEGKILDAKRIEHFLISFKIVEVGGKPIVIYNMKYVKMQNPLVVTFSEVNGKMQITLTPYVDYEVNASWDDPYSADDYADYFKNETRAFEVLHFGGVPDEDLWRDFSANILEKAEKIQTLESLVSSAFRKSENPSPAEIGKLVIEYYKKYLKPNMPIRTQLPRIQAKNNTRSGTPSLPSDEDSEELDIEDDED